MSAHHALPKTSIGILTMPDEQRKFRGNRNNFAEITEKAKQFGIHVFVVTTKDLHLDRERIIAYHYDTSNKQWSSRWTPLPQVIYNRIPFREDEQLPEIRQLIKACLRHPAVTLYNPAFFNKWELFHWLNRSRATKHYIPFTKKYKADIKFLPLLKRYSLLYLKPQSGKAGNGIMRIRRYRKKTKWPYLLSIQEARKSQTHRYASLGQMKEHVANLINEEDYIVQQGITLAKVRERPFDLRVLVQKNKHGRWSVTGIGARLAGEDSITTHVPRGGTIEDPRKMLATTLGSATAKRIMKRIALTAIIIAKQIEKGSGHNLGEMSMDLGIDRSGHLWFFEANSKPMKFDELDIREKSLITMFEYCTYLSTKRKKKVRGGHFVR